MKKEINKQEKKRYWLRGGVIGLGLSILNILINSFNLLGILRKKFGIQWIIYLDFSRLFTKIVTFPLFENIFFKTGEMNMGGEFRELMITGQVFGTILIVLGYFLIGALIGYIYGKIKERRRK